MKIRIKGKRRAREQSINTILCKPKRKRPNHRAKQGPIQVKNKHKPKPNVLQMAPNFTGMAHTTSEAHQTNTRLERLLQGVAAPVGQPPPMGALEAQVW